jgi:hypothetical protein
MPSENAYLKAQLAQSKLLPYREDRQGLGQNPAQVIQGARRLAREMGSPTDATGLPIPTAGGGESNRGFNIYRSRFIRAATAQAMSQGPRGFRNLFGATPGFVDIANALGGKGPNVSSDGTVPSPGAAENPARVTTGLNDTSKNILTAIGMVPALGFGAITGAVQYANIPGVIGPVAPRLNTNAFRQTVAAGRLASGLGRSIGGVRSGSALGAQAARGV